MKIAATLLISTCLVSCAAGGHKYETQIDNKTIDNVNHIISTRVIPDKEKGTPFLIDSISSAFLGTPYQANTLIGSVDKKEVLVANFNGVDCFTLIDYVKALLSANNEDEFLKNLVRTRYINGDVEFLSRKHFFSDWFARSPINAIDVTKEISPEAITVTKRLNFKAPDSEYIPGLEIVRRDITYIPGSAINEQVLSRLHTGDFVGVYTKLEGLDVTHVGIAIRKGGHVWFRNASSLEKNMKVVDTDFLTYMQSKPGIVVLRSK